MAGGTILIADDDTAIRTVLNQALARAGYAPRATGNAATLWRWVSQGVGDVVITDVVMPDENAFDLIPRIKKIAGSPPLVMKRTEHADDGLVGGGRRRFRYLPKPFDLNELVSVAAARCRSPDGARSGERRARHGRAAANRPLAADAGDLPVAGAADAHGPTVMIHR